MKNIDISEITIKLCQEGNTNGSTNEIEILDTTLESPMLVEDKASFYTIRTDGWSIEGDLNTFFNRCKEVVKVLDRD